MLAALLAWRRVRAAPPIVTAGAVGLCAIVFLALAGLAHGVQVRDTVGRQRLAAEDGASLGESSLLLDGRPLVIIAPVGPQAASRAGGISDDEMLVSPSLAVLLRLQGPGSPLRARLPFAIAGEVSEDQLRGPDELVAVVGRSDPGYSPHSSSPPSGSPVGLWLLGVLLLVPSAALLGSALRADERRRQRRLAVLLMLGADRRPVVHTAVLEALMTAVPAFVVASLVFLPTRYLLALLPVSGLRSFPGAVTPSAPLWLAVAAGVLLLAAVVARGTRRRRAAGSRAPWPAARRLLGSWRGRLSASPPTRSWTAGLLMPVGAGTFLTAAALSAVLPEVLLAAGEAAGLALVLFGLGSGGGAMVGAMASVLVRRRRLDAPALVALRRLQQDPSGGYRAVAGLALVLFVFTFASSLNAGAAAVDDGGASPGTEIVVRIGDHAAADVLEPLFELDDVTVVPLALAGDLQPTGLVTTCDGLRVVADDAHLPCEPGTIMAEAPVSTTVVQSVGTDLRGERAQAEVVPGPAFAVRAIHSPVLTGPDFVVALTEAELSRWPLTDVRVVVGSPAAEAAVLRTLAERFPLLAVGREEQLGSPSAAGADVSRGLRLVWVVSAVTGMASLLIAAGDRLDEGRRTAAAMNALGMGHRERRTQATWELLVPVFAAAVPAILLGPGLAVAGARLLGGDARVPWWDLALGTTLVLVLAGCAVLVLSRLSAHLPVAATLRDDA